MTHRVLVLGAGKTGTLIGAMLADTGDFHVTLADRDGGLPGIAMVLDAADEDGVAAWMREHGTDAVVCCLPWFANPPVARAARAACVHYFDLTEDLQSTLVAHEQAADAGTAFVPQCGLAPGVISIAAADLMRRFDEVDTVRLRVGALPAAPDNALKYALTWSTDGLINEYANPCPAIEDGHRVELPPLEDLETLVLDGTVYEAFNTSGGLGSLAESWAGRVRRMNYKTLRYPGHCAQMRFLMRDLRLADDRDTLKRILERALPATDDDIVIMYAGVSGQRDGRFCDEAFVRRIRPAQVAGAPRTAIQLATAAGACAVLDLVLAAPDRHRGIVRQEDFTLGALLDNRFGRHYA